MMEEIIVPRLNPKKCQIKIPRNRILVAAPLKELYLILYQTKKIRKIILKGIILYLLNLRTTIRTAIC